MDKWEQLKSIIESEAAEVAEDGPARYALDWTLKEMGILEDAEQTEASTEDSEQS